LDPALYQTIKLLHIACAALSICGFIVRAALKLRNSPTLKQRWIRTLPHFNDTILLGCAIYLATSIHQYPFANSWLSAKLLALLLYIGMGMVVMRFGRNQKQRIAALIIALLSFSYIVAVALSRSATAGL
jgi:uncharacterized membrane protein SirB2